MTWHIDSNGIVYDNKRLPMGFFDLNGDVYDKNGIGINGQPTGSPVGFVDIAGDAYGKANQHVGFVDIDGSLHNNGNISVGIVELNGEVRDVTRNLIGIVEPSLHKRAHRKNWRQLHYRAAAAVLFILANL
jgi:hypothetical protein